jgi:DNA-directed RNA polymerase specialized sigma24 family protein
VFSRVPDATLALWATDGDVRAVAELHLRHAATAARFAAVVSGRPEEVADMVATAFATALAEPVANEPAIEEPFLPLLLRETRTAALADADHGVDAGQLASSVPASTSPELLAEVFSGLSEPERSAVWLSEVADLSSGDAGVALAVSGGSSALRWTRPRSVGLSALMTRADTTLGDHRAGAIAALAAVDASLDDDHVDAVVAGWPKRRKRVRHKVKLSPNWADLLGSRKPGLGRIVRIAATVVVVVFALGVVLDLRDTGTDRTSEVARRLRVLGQANGQASPSTGGGSNRSATQGGSAGPAGRSQRGSSGSAPSGSRGANSSGASSPGQGSSGAKSRASSQIGVKAANGTTIGVGTTSTTTTVGGSNTGPPAGRGNDPSPRPGSQVTPTTRSPIISSTTQPPAAIPTSTSTPAPPDTSPAPTDPTTTEPPSTTTTTEPPSTTTTTEPPSTTTTTEPPSTTTTTEPPSTTTTTELPTPEPPPITLPPVP